MATDAISFAADPKAENLVRRWTPSERTEAARKILNLEDGQSWRDGDEIFFLVRTEAGENTGTDLARVYGKVEMLKRTGVSFIPHINCRFPTLAEEVEVGLHGKYEARLTAHFLTGRLLAWALEGLAWDNSW